MEPRRGEPSAGGADPYPRAIRFEPAQRDELVRLGVPSEAIELLEVNSLPRIRRWLAPPPRMADVRDELQKVDAALRAAHDAIERLFNAPDSLPHLRGARDAMPGAGARHLFGGIALNRASLALVPAIEAMGEAIAALPAVPSRYKVANDGPIQEIHDALMTGCSYAGLPWVPLKGRLAVHAVQAPHLCPSASPTSAFRRVVGICYERAGMRTTDPERALKSYARRWRKFMEEMADDMRRTEHPPTD